MLFPDDGFDALSGSKEPFEGFGPALPSVGAERAFRVVVSQARERVKSVFNEDIGPDRRGVETVEQVVVTMWQEGWNPEAGDLDLFARDFGALVTDSILSEVGGTLVFRSQTDLSHTSLWWPAQQFEVFPFHRAAKRLVRQEGEGLLYLFDSVCRKVRGEETAPSE